MSLIKASTTSKRPGSQGPSFQETLGACLQDDLDPVSSRSGPGLATGSSWLGSPLPASYWGVRCNYSGPRSHPAVELALRTGKHSLQKQRATIKPNSKTSLMAACSAAEPASEVTQRPPWELIPHYFQLLLQIPPFLLFTQSGGAELLLG